MTTREDTNIRIAKEERSFVLKAAHHTYNINAPYFPTTSLIQAAPRHP